MKNNSTEWTRALINNTAPPQSIMPKLGNVAHSAATGREILFSHSSALTYWRRYALGLIAPGLLQPGQVAQLLDGVSAS